MAVTSFLDKVYDVYENDDFSYGQDNLNPIRELKPVSKFVTDEDRAREIIASRVSSLKTELNNIGILPEEKEDEVSLSFGGDNLSSEKSSKEMASFIKAGTDLDDQNIFGDMIDNDLDNDNAISALTKEIDNLIAQIIARLQGMGFEIPEYLDKTSMSIFNIDCNGIAEEISGLDSNDGNGNIVSDKSGSGNNNGNNNNDNNDNDDDNNDDDNDNDSNDEDLNDVYGFNDAFDKFESEQEKRDNEFDSAAAQCALKELSFLKIILVVLKVVSILKKIVSYALNIAYTVIDIAQLAAGAWLNPTNIGKIAQRIVGRVMAVMQQMLSMMLQMIWDLLNMDCISSAAFSLIDQINAALAGINAVKSELNPKSVTTQLSGLTDKVLKAQSEVEEALKRTKELNPFKKENREKFKEEAKKLWDSTKSAAKDSALGSLKDSKFGKMASRLKESAITTVGSVTTTAPKAQSAVDKLASLPGFSLLDS